MSARPFTAAAPGRSVPVAWTPGKSSPGLESNTPVSPSAGSTPPM